MDHVIRQMITTIRNFQGTLFLTGIGKSAHVVRKCCATWQSLGLRVQTLLIQDMFHGDMGVLQPNDLIL